MPDSNLQLLNVQVFLADRCIIDTTNLLVDAGVLLWLEGGNGAGKSTLLRAITGLLPFKGEITVQGFAAGSLEARQKLLYVPDEPALYEDLTLQEHAEFQARIYSQPEALPRCLALLERFSLTSHLLEFPNSHSRGMRQKLSLALALSLDAPVLLLDEPFNGLDVAAQTVLLSILEERVQQGGTVLLSAHQAQLLGTWLTARWFLHLRLEAGELSEVEAA